MTFPVDPVLDTGVHPDSGPPPPIDWITGVYAADGGMKILSNKFAPNAASNCSCVWKYDFTDPRNVFVDIDTFPTTGDSVEVWLNLLKQGTSTPCGYILRFWHSSGGGVGFLELDRCDNGVNTRLDDVGKTLVAGDQIGLENIAGTLHAYVNGVQQASITSVDTTYYGQSRVALRKISGGGSTERMSLFGAGSNVIAPPGLFDPKLVPQAWL